MFENFERSQIVGDGCRINVIHGGTGPALLLLHGYPQNHVEWHKVAPRLTKHFSVVCPDLRGYGDSEKPPSTNDDLSNYCKKASAADQIAVMRHLGHDLLADQCSTGEQKILLLSIVLAHTQVLTNKFNRPPLIFFDEVMAHLDEDHRRCVIEVLCFLGVQVWLTGVDRGLFSGFGDRAQFLNITNGIITDCNVGKLA